MRTDFDTLSAADAQFLIHIRLPGGMHLHLARAGTASHTDVLERAAVAGRLVPLEMAQGDEDVRVHHCLADLRFPDVFAALNGNVYVVGSFQAVGDQDVAAGIVGIEPILISAFQMVEGVFAAAHIQRVAVSQERFAAHIFDHVDDGAGIVGTKVRQVARFSEVDLDGDEFAVQFHGWKTCFAQKPFQFRLQCVSHLHPQVCVVYF